jgi:alpha-ketoglutarate-dependent sulfate ester dioxygenase
MTATSVPTKLAIRKITARIGAEITGLSPDLTLDPDTVTAVRQALNEHKALVFRGVDLPAPWRSVCSTAILSHR